MEIHFNPNIKPTSVSKKRRKESSGGFKAQVGQTSSATDTTSVVNVQNVNMAEAVFSVQEISSEEELKAHVKDRGSKILGHLDQIHLALLTGSLDMIPIAESNAMN